MAKFGIAGEFDAQAAATYLLNYFCRVFPFFFRVGPCGLHPPWFLTLAQETPACTAVRTAMGLAVPPENDENTDGDGLGSFAVDLAAQQAAARAAAGEADTEEEQERAAAFMQRALAESARMTAACNKDQRKIERNRAAMGGALEPAIAEHAAEVLSPEHAALVAAARAAQQE